MVLGNPCEKVIQPQRGHDPQLENHCARVIQYSKEDIQNHVLQI